MIGKEFEKDEEIIEFNAKGNHIVTLNKTEKHKSYYLPVFNPKIIQVKPVAQRSDGFEDWVMASWDKKALMDIRKVPVFDVELKYVQNTDLEDLHLPKVAPKLAPKQRNAIELAIKEGYYNFPRKIDLEQMAIISKVKRQTFQENLRKAENKILSNSQ